MDAALCINGRPDFSKEEHRAEMQAYMDQPMTLQKKLKAFDKSLYIRITPSKADF